jgi:hypothetical protein
MSLNNFNYQNNRSIPEVNKGTIVTEAEKSINRIGTLIRNIGVILVLLSALLGVVTGTIQNLFKCHHFSCQPVGHPPTPVPDPPSLKATEILEKALHSNLKDCDGLVTDSLFDITNSIFVLTVNPNRVYYQTTTRTRYHEIVYDFDGGIEYDRDNPSGLWNKKTYPAVGGSPLSDYLLQFTNPTLDSNITKVNGWDVYHLEQITGNQDIGGLDIRKDNFYPVRITLNIPTYVNNDTTPTIDVQKIDLSAWNTGKNISIPPPDKIYPTPSP